jgi:hypothetical protein
MATIDPRAADLGRRVQSLVQQQFRGDQRAAFNHYARNGEVPRAQVRQLLEDAGVGNGLTRGAYTSAVMDRFDTNRNGGVSWQEFQGGMRSVGQ